ncbi:zinc-dependent metalloprotease [Pontibacter sp. G13]|uniref:zinc-dependent metalloprotease n=1 Tax=Pontibacter sp. G13 TaxID=3074898 RepID=UPI00288B8BBF|nr:zinc-dependent metalloprotease [Pontibacter sp. G13]WNJ20213.1 zinc-dependent metalloprotease [Pontibacter sp. G13]
MRSTLLLIWACLLLQPIYAQFLSDKADVQAFDGFFDFHYVPAEGSIFLEVHDLGTEFLYVHSLSSGVGSNDLGLDRGQLGDGVVVKFIRSGNKLLLIQPNQDYRAVTDNALEKQSVEQAFAQSVLFGFPIKETQGDTFLINLTPFLMLDAHGVANRLDRAKEGSYRVDASRSTLWMDRTKAFPQNVEFEALLTLAGKPKGKHLRTVTPDAKSLTVIQHHSFVELPDDDYQPRMFDPRCGSYPMSYLDYATPIWEPIRKQFITRHRLAKQNPAAQSSPAVEPIIYYLDPGTPEPIRSALIEGASWWNEAFEAIGYEDAFQVKLLPEGADPMDLRYNMIQWVHRSTRGWSYGGSITDPRTGEILKGHVSLGSLRIRQDFLIAQALMDRPFEKRDDNHEAMLEMALTRIRQLSAHEVGHTLGFAHNFAASTNDRASVMDYPHPTLDIKGGKVDFSNAYDTGIGEWDKVTVAYSYSEVPDGEGEAAYLRGLLDAAFESGLLYITDSDARPQGGANADAHLWDNGADPVEELEHVSDIRRTAMDQFSIDNIRTGASYSTLEDVFVPVYFFHRYQTEAAVKWIGGMTYAYQVKDGVQPEWEPISGSKQTRALEEVLATLEPEFLAIPEDVLALFPPRAPGFGRSRESFKGHTGVAFDPVGAAETAADMTLGLLLNAERLNRISVQHAMDRGLPSLAEVFEEINKTVFEPEASDDLEGEIRQTVQQRTLHHLLNAASQSQTTPQVKAEIFAFLNELASQWQRGKDAFSQELLREYQLYREDPTDFKVIPAPKIPDGSPIGCGHWH